MLHTAHSNFFSSPWIRLICLFLYWLVEKDSIHISHVWSLLVLSWGSIFEKMKCLYPKKVFLKMTKCFRNYNNARPFSGVGKCCIIGKDLEYRQKTEKCVSFFQRNKITYFAKLLPTWWSNLSPSTNYIYVYFSGVGMYQHDVSETKLAKTLENIVMECVSFVGKCIIF